MPARASPPEIGGAPVFTSDELDMYQLVSILRACDRMLSSRYHAIVTSMPARVPSAGVTMDERIRNLMRERGHEHLLMEVDDPDLEDKIVAALRRARRRTRTKFATPSAAPSSAIFRVMARMGVIFRRASARRYPEFPDSHAACAAGRTICRRSVPTLCKLLEAHSGVLVA